MVLATYGNTTHGSGLPKVGAVDLSMATKCSARRDALNLDNDQPAETKARDLLLQYLPDRCECCVASSSNGQSPHFCKEFTRIRQQCTFLSQVLDPEVANA